MEGEMKRKRAKKVVKAIEMVWSSLDSHLYFTYKRNKKARNNEGTKFHQKCVREYAELIKLLSELY